MAGLGKMLFPAFGPDGESGRFEVLRIVRSLQLNIRKEDTVAAEPTIQAKLNQKLWSYWRSISHGPHRNSNFRARR